jgi:hypothetical protein
MRTPEESKIENSHSKRRDIWSGKTNTTPVLYVRAATCICRLRINVIIKSFQTVPWISPLFSPYDQEK